MKNTVPCNREQKRALNAANKVRAVLGMKERTTLPVSENPLDNLLGGKAEIVRKVIVFEKDELAERAAEALRTSTTSMVDGRVGVKMPQSMIHFIDNLNKGRYDNLVD